MDLIRVFSLDNFLGVINKIHDITGVLATCDQNDIKKKVNELDMTDKLKEIEGLIQDISKADLHKNIQSLHHSLVSLHDSVESVHNAITKLSSKLKDHNEKWFSYWRTLEHNQDINELLIADEIMNKRYTRVKDLLKINWTNFK